MLVLLMILVMMVAPASAAAEGNQVLVKTPSGWKIASILPIPAPAP
jgi:hypothetical protein